MMTPIQMFRGARAMVRITMDPTRLEEVFVLADLAEESPELQRMLEDIRKDPQLARTLDEKPRLGRVDLEELGKLPAGTLGRAYSEFMRARGLAHEDLLLVEGEREIDFLRNHLRETHDLWHVATGFDTDVAGELGVQAFYLAQFQGPLPIVLISAGLLNTLFRAMDDSGRRIHAIARGWILGRRARALFGMRWADRWSQPLEDLRRDFAIDIASVDAFLADRGPEAALRAAA
jgi:ubiquinone biosynthesis protein COQ4